METGYFKTYEQDRLAEPEDDIFCQFYDSGVSRAHTQPGHFEFYLDIQDKNAEPSNDYEFDDFNTNDDEDSSDYFLASSVDTVINAPFMSRAAARGFGVKDVAAPVNFAKAATPKLPLSGSQGSLNNSFNSYTNSLAKNFLNDNKMNVNSKSNKVSSKQQLTGSQAPITAQIPIESSKQQQQAATPKQQQQQGKSKSNPSKTNMITNSIKKLFKKKGLEAKQPTKVRWNAYF